MSSPWPLFVLDLCNRSKAQRYAPKRRVVSTRNMHGPCSTVCSLMRNMPLLLWVHRSEYICNNNSNKIDDVVKCVRALASSWSQRTFVYHSFVRCQNEQTPQQRRGKNSMPEIMYNFAHSKPALRVCVCALACARAPDGDRDSMYINQTIINHFRCHIVYMAWNLTCRRLIHFWLDSIIVCSAQMPLKCTHNPISLASKQKRTQPNGNIYRRVRVQRGAVLQLLASLRQRLRPTEWTPFQNSHAACRRDSFVWFSCARVCVCVSVWRCRCEKSGGLSEFIWEALLGV